MPSDCLRRCGVPWAGKAGQSPWRSFAGRWALAQIVEREAIVHPEFRQDLRYWVTTDRKAALRIFELIEAALRDPLTGIGKPEPRKYVLAGCWCRRAIQEHLLVSVSSDGSLDCR